MSLCRFWSPPHRRWETGSGTCAVQVRGGGGVGAFLAPLATAAVRNAGVCVRLSRARLVGACEAVPRSACIEARAFASAGVVWRVRATQDTGVRAVTRSERVLNPEAVALGDVRAARQQNAPGHAPSAPA